MHLYFNTLQRVTESNQTKQCHPIPYPFECLEAIWGDCFNPSPKHPVNWGIIIKKTRNVERNLNLVGGLVAIFGIFPFSWEFHHPN